MQTPRPVAAVEHGRRGRSANVSASVASLLETLLVVGVIALLLPAFARLADSGSGRDRRFDETGFRVLGLPEPVLPALCAGVGSLAEPAVRDRLCADAATGTTLSLDKLPPLLADARVRTDEAFLAPLKEVDARLAALRRQARDGAGELRALSDTIASLEADARPFVERFDLAPAEGRGPAPLACAHRLVAAALAEPLTGGVRDDGQALRRANALLLLAAAFDGHPATEAVAHGAVLPLGAEACDARGITGAVGSAAALMGEARQTLLQSRKNEAMRDLLPVAGWQWAGWMLLGLMLLKLSRTGLRPAVGVAAALALWAGAAWIARVPWPLSGARSFELARVDAALWSEPAGFVIALAGAAALLLVAAWAGRSQDEIRGPSGTPSGPGFHPGYVAQTMSSRIGYAGLVAATGLGWVLLLDLSANGYAGNRYLALYHQGHLWLAMLVFCVVLFVRQPLARGLAWTLSITGELARAAGRRIGAWHSLLAVVIVGAGVIAVFGLALANTRQFTSELGRLWLVVGAAWFFFLRGGPLAERLARSGAAGGSVWRYLWPLLFVVAVLVGAMFATRDMGPLLIACYGSGAFLAASLAAWAQQRFGAKRLALLLAMLAFTAWIAGTTLVLFKLGAADSVTAGRLESLAAPFASTNDQLALVSWFQRAAPADGFGLGAVPWCGYSAAGRCSGVPAQIHSDYTFTAIGGAFGMLSAWAVALACAVWLHRLVRHHGRVSSGEPRFVPASGRVVSDGQAFLSWICVAWVVLTLCQLAVTVAGNMAVLPLTGVTFPFVSFGMTSLVTGMAFLALCINLDLPPEGEHG